MKKMITSCKTVILSSLIAVQAMAQQPAADSTSYLDNNFHNKAQLLTNQIIQSKAFQMTYIGVPLIVSGLIVKSNDDHFRSLRNAYIPIFRNHYDDYLQYVPLVATFGLKAAGVEGRSSWGRMLVSDAFSATLLAAAVNGIKYTAKVPRPDGSSRNSFPSGHTAVAFMGATILHKEYGLTRSPWYSVGGYAVATATAVSRMLNNRHWMSDVLAGAGIGILSTEVGYFLADLIFKDKGITSKNLDFSDFDYDRNPSFFGLYAGFSLMPAHYQLSPHINLKATTGTTAGFEGAWFMNRYVGFGGRIAATSMPITLTEALPWPEVQQLESNPLNYITTSVGTYLSYPVTDHFLVGGKLLLGVNYIGDNTLFALYQKETEKAQEIKITQVGDEFNANLTTGVSISYVLKPQLGIRLFFDYSLNPAKFDTEYFVEMPQSESGRSQTILHSMTLGASVNVMLW